MPMPLEQAVVVITGASSGIGQAAALRIARRGGSLALCGRSSGPLLDVARQCEEAGATVHAEALDVSDEAAVDAFAATTVARFGRSDVWVNGAGVIAYGEFFEIPPDVFRQVIETNLMGQVHGARAALRDFRERGSGVLITMSSVWGRVSSPQVSPYIVSKSAVGALAECLRGELASEPDIHVTTMARRPSTRRSSSTAATAPHAVDGAWRRQRPNSLKRAFGAATAGALGGIARRQR